jgi:methionyl-tRNA formyltransferase
VANGNLVFFGTNDIAVPFLTELEKDYRLGLIVTQPDSIGGRNRQPLLPPVKHFAVERGIDVVQPKKLKNQELHERIRALEPLAAVVVSYGRLIPKTLYSLPRHGTLNVHFSLLPLYRGAAPVQRAIEDGESRTGITVFEISERLDAGDIWAVLEMEIDPAETSAMLFRRMTAVGPVFLRETMEKIFSVEITKHPQDDSRATLAPALEKKEGRIEWTRTAMRIHNQFRAFIPWPGLCFMSVSKTMKVRQCRPAPVGMSHRQTPGAFHSLDRSALRICCGEGTVLEIAELQPEGKQPMSPFQYSLGNPFPDLFT